MDGDGINFCDAEAQYELSLNLAAVKQNSGRMEDRAERKHGPVKKRKRVQKILSSLVQTHTFVLSEKLENQSMLGKKKFALPLLQFVQS